MKKWWTLVSTMAMVVILCGYATAQQNFSISPVLIPQLNDPCAEADSPAGNIAWGLRPGHEIAYCSPERQFDVAMSVKVQVKVDGTIIGNLMADTCNSGGRVSIRCYLTATRAMLDLTSVPGRHVMILTPVEPATGALRPPFEPLTIFTGCPSFNMTVSPATVLPGYLAVGTSMGQRNQMSTNNFMITVAKMRDLGWRVEWQRVQFSETTTSGAGYWYLGATCYGTPQ